MNEPVVIHVPIPMLPEALTQQAHAYIRARSVTILATESSGDQNALPCGATLVSIHGKPSLLTARHVWDSIRNHGVLAIVIGDQVIRIDATNLHGISPPGPTGRLRDAEVPDIALVRLAHSDAAEIEARGRAFYSVEKRRKLAHEFLRRDDGFLVVTGSPIERLDRESGRVASFLFDTNGGALERQGDWDYQLVNLNVESNPEIPRNFQGTSGGGLWRVAIQISRDRRSMWIENPSTDIVLVGVNFFQTALPHRQLLCHGPESIYSRMFELSAESP